ncbi:flagellar hook-length control protein FliK [Paenibacillus aceris]|uniref:Flagellar hook-length control protein FliK n=1 Tax=Paenibacillus aceris TaxID=869555 RepID=A0ABS4HR75_9BACL|nr:flagellar hook-length control protein FliK [Paenibacillus aceris]MBP1961107.1 flagellar hook-length control protein FliK [Paenibacillus aceris]NHW35236.1 flagellar hook-length control protein FliK [Paenibacillus aceris]
MDIQIQTVPTANPVSSSNNKAVASGTTSKDGFTDVLSQKSQDTSSDESTNASDPALSLSMLLQMLQSLVAPVQGATVQDAKPEEQTLPEVVLEAMNSNPGLAEQLLQDPKVQKWFEEAQQLLQTLGGAQSIPAAAFSSSLKLQSTEVSSLQAQNTLLSLVSLSKQQPDNPIMKFLNQGLQNVTQPLLPELMVGSRKATQQNFESMNAATMVQPTKSKLELLAMKNVHLAPNVDPISPSGDSLLNLVDLPTEAEAAPNTVVTIADMQRAQQAPTVVDKTTISTVNASNFAEEMTTHVLKNMKITLADGFSEAKLSLFPKNLGHVDVRISMHDGQLIAQFAADSLAAKQMLENQLPQLRQALQLQGLQVEKLEVTQNQNMQSSLFQEQRQQQAFGQSQRQNKNSSSGNSYDVESVDFDQEMDTSVQARPAIHGNSFDVTA